MGPGAEAPFRTRIVVRRPSDPGRFSGTVVVEWHNVSAGIDAAPDWGFFHRHLAAAGHAWVGVSAQKVGIDGGGFVQSIHLKLLAPERYSELEHPGDAWSFDMFTQVAELVRLPAEQNPLGGLVARHVLAAGESQSAACLVTYINAVDPHSQVFDGYFVHGRPGIGVSIDGVFIPTRDGLGFEETTRMISSSGERIREDARVPVLILQSETDLVVLGGHRAAQPDSEHIRVWEMPGAAHADTYTVSAGRHDDGTLSAERLAELLRPTRNLIMGETPTPVNSGPQQHYVAQAALARLVRLGDRRPGRPVGAPARPRGVRPRLPPRRPGQRHGRHPHAVGRRADRRALRAGPDRSWTSPSSSAVPSPSTRPRWLRSTRAARASTSSGSRHHSTPPSRPGSSWARTATRSSASAPPPIPCGWPRSSRPGMRSASVAEKRILFSLGRVMEHAPMLYCQGLRKRYGDRLAVDGVSFSIGADECYGLLGPNGAGKTTTISMLCGLVLRDEGQITIDGHEGGTLEAKKTVGYVPQDLALYPDLSATENLTFFGQLYGLSGKGLEARIAETLELVGLADRGKDRIGTYSGGMKRRANMAAGLLHKPKLLVLDEPTVGVDPQSRNAILETVAALGIAVLYTTHYMEEASKLCDRIGIIDDGHLVAEGTAEGLIGQHGGRDKVHLDCAAESLDELAAACRELENVHDVREIEGHLELTTDHGPAVLPAVVAVAGRHRVELTGVEVRSPNLEDVFLSLTGKELRD